jgi:hypothetical protein
VTCSYCNQSGHNVRTCPKKTHDDAVRAGPAQPVASGEPIVPPQDESSVAPVITAVPAPSERSNGPASAPNPPDVNPPNSQLFGQTTNAMLRCGAAGMELFGKFIDVLPKLKTVIQLTGGVVLLGAIVAYRTVPPEMVPGVLATGDIGIFLIVVGLGASYLRLIDKAQRAWLAFWVFVVLCLTLILLFYIANSLLVTNKTVTFRMKVQGMETVNLERDGSPKKLEIRAGGKTIQLNPNSEGVESKTLPFGTKEFAIVSALWRGFRLNSSQPRRQWSCYFGRVVNGSLNLEG